MTQTQEPVLIAVLCPREDCPVEFARKAIREYSLTLKRTPTYTYGHCITCERCKQIKCWRKLADGSEIATAQA